MRYVTRLLPFLVCLAGLALVACEQPQETATPAPAPPAMEPEPEAVDEANLVAVARLQPRSDTTATGTVTFTQNGDNVEVVAEISGVTVGTGGSHGLHLHEFGDCSAPDFSSAGDHFNPTGTPHGAPSDAEHHAGDFGNIEIGEDGTGKLDLSSKMLTVEDGANSVVGHAVILHERADDLQSQPSGDAGSRIACGVVELQGGMMDEGMMDDGMMDEGMADDPGVTDPTP